MFSVIQTFVMNFVFISLCEFSIVSKYDEMNCNLVSRVFYNLFKVQILVIWNNHDSSVLMNDNVKCVENQSIINECMQVKCKFVVSIMWNIL